MAGFWEKVPCGTRTISFPEGSIDYFRCLEDEREAREPFIAQFAAFASSRGKSVLEVGIGAATDFIRFARNGARLTGVDLTEHAVELASTRLSQERLNAAVLRADAESLPFGDGSFDIVYSWGVIHHTPSTRRAAEEIMRVARPGGRICVMVYHRYSYVALQCWLLHALVKGKPWRSFSDVIWHHIESLGTQAFSVGEVRHLFSALINLRVTPVVTPYDMRIGRSRFLPAGMRRLFPERFGWFLVVGGEKAK
jgi:ubiquinone/menaquinone biosynthesis C-methylase UbiE